MQTLKAKQIEMLIEVVKSSLPVSPNECEYRRAIPKDMSEQASAKTRQEEKARLIDRLTGFCLATRSF